MISHLCLVLFLFRIMNGRQTGGRSVLVLYRVANSESDGSTPLYNCFKMPFGSGPTLSAVKQHCAAAHSLSHLGPEGYHWRVLVEDRAASSSDPKSFSWWDIQDGNAKLPVKECTQYELNKLLFPTKAAATTADTAAKAAKGAFKMMNKMASAAVGVEESTGPPVSVLAFKLVDLVKIQDDYNKKYGGQGAPPPPKPRRIKTPTTRSQPSRATSTQARPQQQRRPQQTRQAAASQDASLLDFDSPGKIAQKKTLNNLMSGSATSQSNVNPNETRAQRLKREQAQRMKTQNRVWDDVDQRWVEVKPKNTPVQAARAAKPKPKEVGKSLDMSAAVGKSENVQRAVHKRVTEMQQQQEKAKQEIREREAKKKREEEEEDVVRRQLEPKIKAWSEEHGKKKQIRALLATLHTILWPGTKWKQISIGDLLDDRKVKKFFHKATLVVHPDKTHDLPAEQRFLAKRIFDALSQAKKEFDEGK